MTNQNSEHQHQTSELLDTDEIIGEINFALPQEFFYSQMVREMRLLKGKPFNLDFSQKISPKTKINFVYRDKVILGRRNDKEAYIHPDYSDVYINEIILEKTAIIRSKNKKEI